MKPHSPIRDAFDRKLADMQRERDEYRDLAEETGRDLACVIEQRDSAIVQRDAFLMRLKRMAKKLAVADQEIMRLRNAARSE